MNWTFVLHLLFIVVFSYIFRVEYVRVRDALKASNIKTPNPLWFAFYGVVITSSGLAVLSFILKWLIA